MIMNSLTMSGTKPILKKIILSYQEWREALKIPQPQKNKKKYSRKSKHKNKSYE